MKKNVKATPQPGVQGTVVSGCNFTAEATPPEPTANVAARADAVKSIADACKVNAEALSKAADALRGPVIHTDNSCLLKIGG